MVRPWWGGGSRKKAVFSVRGGQKLQYKGPGGGSPKLKFWLLGRQNLCIVILTLWENHGFSSRDLRPLLGPAYRRPLLAKWPNVQICAKFGADLGQKSAHLARFLGAFLAGLGRAGGAVRSKGLCCTRLALRAEAVHHAAWYEIIRALRDRFKFVSRI